jgi:hypothetical protein
MFHSGITWIRPQYRRISRKNGRKTNHKGDRYTLRHYLTGFCKIVLDLNHLPFKADTCLTIKYIADTH